MNEKILEKFETLIDKTLDEAMTKSAITNREDTLSVITTVAKVLEKISAIEIAQARAVKYPPVIDCGEFNLKHRQREQP